MLPKGQPKDGKGKHAISLPQNEMRFSSRAILAPTASPMLLHFCFEANMWIKAHQGQKSPLVAEEGPSVAKYKCSPSVAEYTYSPSVA